jgi:protein arginine kinase
MTGTKLPKSLLEHPPWETENNPIWLATSFLLHRNLAKYHFPQKMNEHQCAQTLSILKERLLQSPQLKNPLFLNPEEMGFLDREFLFEHFLSGENFQNAPGGEGFVIDDSGSFLARINIQNHLQIQLTDCQGKWEEAWNTLSQIETGIGTTAEFAFSSKFGYLTAEPFLCGTGLNVQTWLHLPAMVHMEQLEETLLKQKEEGIQVTGMGGLLSEITGDLVVISNTCTLGISEESIIQSVHSMAMKLMAMEKTLRSHLLTENNTRIKDQVSRSFGLLLHSWQLQTAEALGALSLLKLGLHLDWVRGITERQLNALFFQCRKSHLLHMLGELHLTEPQEIAHKRAEFLHKNMQGVVLKIESPG